VLYHYTTTKINIKTHEMNELKTTFRAHSQIDKVFTTMMQQATISKTSLETGNMLGDGHSVIPEG